MQTFGLDFTVFISRLGEHIIVLLHCSKMRATTYKMDIIHSVYMQQGF